MNKSVQIVLLISLLLSVFTVCVWIYSAQQKYSVSNSGSDFFSFQKSVLPQIREEYSALIAPKNVKLEILQDPSEELNKVYRLVSISISSDAKYSMAFIANRQSNSQRSYQIDDFLDGFGKISEITVNRVTVMTPQGPIYLSSGNLENPNIADIRAQGGEGEISTLLHKFGGQMISTNEYSFNRDSIMKYYNELMARPERLVALFDTFTPIYNGKKIDGYKIDIKGEEDFLTAVGLKQGDIIRSVNYIQMNSRWPAEKLIEDFAKKNLDLFVFEIERDTDKLQYRYHCPAP